MDTSKFWYERTFSKRGESVVKARQATDRVLNCDLLNHGFVDTLDQPGVAPGPVRQAESHCTCHGTFVLITCICYVL